MTEPEARRHHQRVMWIAVTLLGAATIYLTWDHVRDNLATVELADQVTEVCARDSSAATELAERGACQTAEEVKVIAGPAGPAGPRGPRGDTGPAGPRGSTGPTGPAGQSPACLSEPNQCRGLLGSAGPPGPAGPAGPAGPQGEPGPAGADGQSPPCLADGTNCVGPVGAQGPRGPEGPAGPTGPPGPTCPEGYTLQERQQITETWYVCVQDDPAPAG